MKATLIQMDIRQADAATNRETAERAILDAPKSDLYVLPEMWTTGFVTRPQGIAEADGLSLEWMTRMARRLDAAVCGSIATEENGRYYNRLYFVTPKRIQRTEAYAEKVRQLFAATVNEILALNKSVPTLDEGVMYSFDGDNMRIQKKVEALLRQLHSTTTTAIKKGITLEWEKANDACDKLISSCFGKEVLSSPEFSAWNNRNMAAMNAFTNRTENGLNLSKRIWQSVQQLRDEMEIAMTVAIGEGDSAQSISRKVRQYLNDPDLMFRRFRFKKGEDEQGKPIYGRKW